MTSRNDLLALYRVDQQLRGLEVQFAEAKRDALAEQKTVSALQAERIELSEQLHHAQAKASINEKELTEFDERIADRRRRMHESKTNKQYQSLLLEIDSIRSQQQGFEEVVGSHAAAIEKLERKVGHVESTLEEHQRREQATEKRLASLHEEHGYHVEQLRAQREQALEQTASSDRSLYERLWEAYDGEPFAAIEEQDRRRFDYNCMGCFLQVPVERVSQLLSTSELIQCPNCNRLLFIEEELHASLVSQKQTA